MGGIGVAVLLVVGTMLATGVIPRAQNGNPPTSACPPNDGAVIGSCFTAGNPTASVCAAGSAQTIGAAVITGGCHVGDYIYTLTVESSTISFSSILMEVKTSSGAVYGGGTANSGFSVLNVAGNVVAVSVTGTTLAMSGTWTSYGPTTTPTTSTSTPLTNLYTVVIDMGTTNPGGQRDVFVPTIPGEPYPAIGLALP
jgi:hypothetical protein